MPSLAPGERLGPYEILAPLGEGGMGEVYKARDTRLEGIVAIKTSLRELPHHRRDSVLRGLRRICSITYAKAP